MTPFHTSSVRVGLLTLAGLVSACSGGPAETPEAKPAVAKDAEPEANAKPAEPEAKPVPKISKKDKASVVIITMDTTRVDRLGAYGYEKALTPTVDGLAAKGLRFDRAYSVVPLTTPSHASMMTGLYPTRHGIHNNGDAILGDEYTTLAEVLSGNGYATAAAISAFVTTRVWNLDQGFQDYFDKVQGDASRRNRGRWAQERPADEVVNDLIGWLDEHKDDDRPFLLWAHFYDPHDPYAPPKEWLEKAEGRAYDGEIGFMDAQIARLKEAVDARTGDAGTAWVLVADHGEALTREHGEHTHGMYLYNPTMHIPFIVKPPKDLPATKVEDTHAVSNVDVTPTVLGMLGYDVPKDLDGLDLSPLLGDGTIEDRDPVYMEAESARNRFGFAPEKALAHRELKLMDTPNPRLFDVKADPGETKNLVPDRPDDVARLQKAHEDIKAKRSDSTSGAGAASPEVLAQLEALGYMTSDASVGDDETLKLDAKDQKELIGRLDKARMMSRRGKLKKAIELYQSVLDEHPHISEARMNMARAYTQMRQPDKAEEILRKAIEMDPDSTVLKSNYAAQLVQKGDFEGAYKYYEMILMQVPGDDVARNGIARLYLASNQYDKALEVATQWKAADPDDLSWDAYRGIALARLNRIPEAIPALQRALGDDMPRKDVHGTLGTIAQMSGDLTQALKHFHAETEWFPDDFTTRMRVASIYMREKNWEEAASEFAYVAEMRPRDPISRRMWAQAIFNTGDYPSAAKILEPALAAAPDDPYVLLMHANILQKLGKEEEGQKVFDRATELRQAQVDARKQAMEGDGMPELGPTDPTLEMEQYGIPE